eukprot:TRINITY_DN47370_c0_g1_i1.p2 TRINITY_DN47370_c0_g1~~TRINITY_DN47370_c0_g1_i1.p2  ORF type:complete len:127 (-),score=2.21 TRINITY_DN47370_c0_g1_i1:218-598(-)
MGSSAAGREAPNNSRYWPSRNPRPLRRRRMILLAHRASREFPAVVNPRPAIENSCNFPVCEPGINTIKRNQGVAQYKACPCPADRFGGVLGSDYAAGVFKYPEFDLSLGESAEIQMHPDRFDAHER